MVKLVCSCCGFEMSIKLDYTKYNPVCCPVCRAPVSEPERPQGRGAAFKRPPLSPREVDPA
jgi:hypothetical protein